MSVYAYLRQSSGSNDQSVSIDQQEENCKALAERNKLKITKVFSDYNTSGRIYPTQLSSLAEIDSVYKQFMKETKKSGWRVELSNLLETLKKNDTIIIDDKTRLVRSLNGSFLENGLIQILKDKKIRLISNKEGEINFENFTDQLVFSLQSSINSNQLEIQRQKSKASIARLYNNGELKQGASQMIGYKSTGKKKEIEIDQEKAPIVKYIFKSYIEGKSLLQIVRDLNSKFKLKSCVKSIKNILNRPFYCGYQYNKSGELVKSKQVEGKELIDLNTWTTAKKILDSRKTNNIRIKQYPLHWTGLCRCGICGSKMSVCINQKGKYFSYRCMSHTIRSKENCKISITANTIYSKGLSLDDVISPLLIIGLLKKLQANPNKDKEQLEQKRIELQNLLVQEKKFTELFFNNLVDETIYEEHLKQNKEKKDNLQQEIIQLENNLAEDNSEQIRHLVNKIVVRRLSFEEYQELIPYSIKDIVVYQDKVVVNTVEGPIELKRYKDRGIQKQYEYIWSNNPPKYKIIYYKEVPNIYKNKTTLFKSTNLTIQQLEEN